MIAARFGLHFETPHFPKPWRSPDGTVLVLYVGPAGRVVPFRLSAPRSVKQ